MFSQFSQRTLFHQLLLPSRNSPWCYGTICARATPKHWWLPSCLPLHNTLPKPSIPRNMLESYRSVNWLKNKMYYYNVIFKRGLQQLHHFVRIVRPWISIFIFPRCGSTTPCCPWPFALITILLNVGQFQTNNFAKFTDMDSNWGHLWTSSLFRDSNADKSDVVNVGSICISEMDSSSSTGQLFITASRPIRLPIETYLSSIGHQ